MTNTTLPEQDRTRVKTRDLTPKQRRTVRRVINFYRDRESYNNVTSVRFELTRPYGCFLSLTVRTRRSDCGKYSQRQILCERRAHFYIGKRGGLKLYSSDSGMRDDSAHVCNMLNCRKV